MITPARLLALALMVTVSATTSAATPAAQTANSDPATATPIKHLVVIFGENVSFDHYFATYPHAANPSGEPRFVADGPVPAANTLTAAHLLDHNPNIAAANGDDAANPFRLDRTQASTSDQNHAYTAEEQAYDGGKADEFPKYTGHGSAGGVGAFGTRGQVMGYYDGNTVTALWQYAQRFAMSDNAFTDTYGPSTPGAIEIVSGQTNGLQLTATTRKSATAGGYSYYVDDGQGGYTMINDVDPTYDTCSSVKDNANLRGRNIGDLLNAGGIRWGGFMGGFNLKAVNANGTTGCKRSTHSTVIGEDIPDYIAHHNWFAYYRSTSNPTHAGPSSIAAIGSSVETNGTTPEPANHEYDLHDFYAAVQAGNFPAVSYVKSPAFQDAHAGYSDPLDEQTSVVTLLDFLQRQPEWKDTAVILAYDDSDGWYDHAAAAPTHASFDPGADRLNGAGVCGSGTAPMGIDGKPVNGRCGPGTRLPFIVVSPWAKQNAVMHDRISLASVPRFIEDNWLHGTRLGGGSFDADAGSIMDLFDFSSPPRMTALYLDPSTGEPISSAAAARITPFGR